MECCNDECHQGRKCPNQVAPIKLRYPRHTPCEPESWRRFLAKSAAFALATIVMAMVVAAVHLLIRLLT